MTSLLKTVVVAAVFSLVAVGATLFYIDHKIDEMTQTVRAPIQTAADAVTVAVQAAEDSVTSVIGSVGDAAGSAAEFVETATEKIDTATADLGDAVDTAAAKLDTTADGAEALYVDLTSYVADARNALQDRWSDAKSAMTESWASSMNEAVLSLQAAEDRASDLEAQARRYLDRLSDSY